MHTPQPITAPDASPSVWRVELIETVRLALPIALTSSARSR
jgi:hypothetical protein